MDPWTPLMSRTQHKLLPIGTKGQCAQWQRLRLKLLVKLQRLKQKAQSQAFLSPETSTPSSSVTTSENAEGNCQQKCTHWPFYLVPLTSINCVTHT